MSDIFLAEGIEEKVAIVDADSIVYYVGYAADALDEDARFACELLDKSIGEIAENLQCTAMELYLGTTTNYRKEIATLKKYKGERKESNRPVFYDALRYRLVKDHGAILCEGEEAEDTVGIRAYTFDNYNNFVVCNVDKDVDMISGHHYNYRTKKKYFVDSYQALRNFYLQLVTGDMTDNIPGLYHQLLIDGDEELAKQFRYSRYKSKLIKELAELNTEEDMWEAVLFIYDDYGQYHTHGLTRILEIGRLLWIRRNEDELWVPPTQREFDYITNDKRENDDE